MDIAFKTRHFANNRQKTQGRHGGLPLRQTVPGLTCHCINGGLEACRDFNNAGKNLAWYRAPSAGIYAAGVLPCPLLAQQTGVVTGRVRDVTSLEPVVAAQVFVPGTGINVVG